MLNEVKVGLKVPPLIAVGSKRRKGYENFYYRPGNNVAMFMEGSKNIKGTIQTVGFFLTKGHGMFKGGDVTSSFLIKLFEVDTNGMPGKQITKDSIIVSGKKEWAWFDVDVSAYHIQNPDSGFFVSFTMLDYTHYKRISPIDPNITSYSAEDSTYGQKLPPELSGHAVFNTPRLCLTDNEFKTAQSYIFITTFDNFVLHWEKLAGNQSFMIRAAIAPE